MNDPPQPGVAGRASSVRSVVPWDGDGRLRSGGVEAVHDPGSRVQLGVVRDLGAREHDRDIGVQNTEAGVVRVVVDEDDGADTALGELLELGALERQILVVLVGLHDEPDLGIFRGGEAVRLEGLEESRAHVRLVATGQVENGDATLENRPRERDGPGEGGVEPLVEVREELLLPEHVELGDERFDRFRFGLGLRTPLDGAPEGVGELVPQVLQGHAEQRVTNPRIPDDLTGELVDDGELAGPVVEQRAVEVEDRDRLNAILLMHLGLPDGSLDHITSLGDQMRSLHRTLTCGPLTACGTLHTTVV